MTPRLVVLNARDAANRGAAIHTRTKCVRAHRKGDTWHVILKDMVSGEEKRGYRTRVGERGWSVVLLT